MAADNSTRPIRSTLSMSATNPVGRVALVAPLVQKPRVGILELLGTVENIDHDGLIAMKVWAEHAVADHPRYPVAISADVRGKRAHIVELMRLAEMVDDAGVRALCQKATELRCSRISADIVQIPKRPVSKDRKPRAAP